VRTWPALRLSGLDAPEYGEAADLVQAELVGHQVSAVDEASPNEWCLYFPSEATRDAAATALRTAFPSLALVSLTVEDEDWAARSQAELRAVRVGGIRVSPPWDRAPEGADVIDVVILPSMGFGTGHHATTRLCLQALQQVPIAGARMIDVGTGSGVLAIAASRLGASTVDGIDDDPDALQAAIDNLTLNPTARVSFEVRDLRHSTHAAYDIVVANLTGALLVAAAPTIQALAHPGGRLVLSGLLETERDNVLAAYTSSEVVTTAVEDAWACLVLMRR
jgi:ribosomal protein L11 methyltransferase